MKLVDHVFCLSRRCSLGKERLRKLQGSLHNGTLQEQKIQSKITDLLFRVSFCAAVITVRTLCRMPEKELVVLHLKVSWRSCPGVRSGLSLWNSMQVIPFQSLALTA